MKNLNTAAKFKLTKTVVTRFTKPGTAQEAAGLRTTLLTTVSSFVAF
ncbi:hypothetical protein [Hymenobacter metallilatus]|nr:hypothetical protein [Hymenobacter metallilatus]